MSQELGLRERKKQRTRELIAETARGLFVERGFDRVTVAEVARAAEVSEATVFNYFPAKEDLVYGRMELFEQELLEAIRKRRPGESILTAFVRFVTQSRGLLASGAPDAMEQLRALTELITGSPALLAREQQIYEGYTRALARVIADETGARTGDIVPFVAANALIGVHRALIDHVRREVLAGERDRTRIARGVRAQAKRAVALLEHGFVHLGA